MSMKKQRRKELLQRKITGFYKTEEKMMANVSNKISFVLTVSLHRIR